MLILLLSAFAPGQWTPKRHFTIQDGLAQSQVTALVQDAHGYLWAATHGGVCRYDGQRFATYTTRDGLPDDVVGALAADASGGLWMGTDSGSLAYWDGYEIQSHPGPESGRVNSVTGLGLLPNGGLLVGTVWGLWRRSGETYEPLLDVPVQRIVPDPAGGAWVVADKPYLCRDGDCRPVPLPSDTGLGTLSTLAPFEGGFWVADRAGKLAYVKDGKALRVLSTSVEEARSILPASMDEIWVGGFNGLWRCDGAGRCGLQTLQATESRLRIGALLRDHEGNLWIGSWGNGLFQQPARAFTIFDLESGLKSSTIWNLVEDREGCIWMASNTSGVFCWCEGTWGRRLSIADGLPADRVVSLLLTPRDALWMGTNRGVAYWDRKNRVRTWSAWDGAPQDMVTSLVLDRHGGLWAGTMGGLARYADDKWTMFLEDQGMPSRLIRGMAMDLTGTLWIATRDAGVVSYDGKIFRTFGTKEGVPNERVWCVLVDSANRVWAGTDGGLWIHPLDGGPDRVIADPAALPSLNILFLLEDREGMIWVGTNRGVVRFSGEGRALRLFTAGSGFSDSEAAENAVLLDRKGRLWFGMASGVTRVDALSIHENTVPPPLVLERVLVNGEPIRAGLPYSSARGGPEPSLALSSGAREIRFEFAALSYMAPDQVRYRFTLEGYEPPPARPSEDTHASYRNLRPGRYRFVLEACNNDGVWAPRPLTLRVVLQPAWYQTMIFRGMAGLFLFLASAGALWLRAATQRRLREHLEDQVRRRTSELSSANEQILNQNRLLEDLSRTDPLTGLANRRVLEEQFPLEMAIQHREFERVKPEALDAYFGLALIVLDLDDFKNVNDRFGHDAGDDVLRRMAERMHRSLREIDLCARWGGDEFVVLCRAVNRQGLLEVVRRLLAETAGIPAGEGTQAQVTVSMGFLAYPLSAGAHLAPKEWMSLFQIADQLMYKAKREGKARACGIVGSHWSVPRISETSLLEALSEDVTHPPHGLDLIHLAADPVLPLS